eukprot:TRINITY_DN11987_c0_g1_i1.p1 TRINITY_DN11987_c0_g1~~TRINITY_DN11987_c0_g1_i1.p1  ORF type:complete len:943 (-),score=231.60 TRINITY_DN11987_c0_g1_i1:86-2863(-)
MYVYILWALASAILSNAITIDEFNRKYQVPQGANVLIFGQASHLDWDWLNWFPTNVNNNPPSVINYWSSTSQPTDVIFTQATNYLQNPLYGYSVCEMSFLRRFWIDFPSRFKNMTSSAGTLSIVGGGITSPDNLLPHGEAVIRNYLTGVSWLKSVNVDWSSTVWLPDDFGHDSQLPSLFASMGVTGVSFARVPGSCYQGKNPQPSDTLSAFDYLLDEKTGGLDFVWKANDGTGLYTYFQPAHYCAGDGLFSSDCEDNSPTSLKTCQCNTKTTSPFERILAYTGVRLPLAKTPYMFIATGCDFAVPIPDLVKTLADWNAKMFASTNVFCVSASFADYTDLVGQYTTEKGILLPHRNYHGATPDTTFKPTPYWMGFYSSRVANKQLHYATVRNLVSSEVLLSLSSAVTGLNKYVSVSFKDLDSVWNLTAPSTHHDYITGTATDYVYLGEQLPLLTTTSSTSKKQLNTLVSQLTQAFNVNNVANAYVFGWNTNGFEIHQVPATFVLTEEQQNDEDFLAEIESHSGIQKMSDGRYKAVMSVPSLGFSSSPASALQASSGLNGYWVEDSFVLENKHLRATVSSTSNWAITSLIDKLTGDVVSHHANFLEFRNDQGDLYRFGYEEGCGFDKYAISVVPGSGKVIDNGPVELAFQATINVKTSSWSNSYVITYTLDSEQPFLQIAVTGSASNYTSVLAGFTFSDNIPSYSHGTTYHWDTKLPFPYGLQNDFKVTMEATHDYVIPTKADGSFFGAVYHNSTPAWGVLGSTLYGVILRNSPSDCAGKGASGHDNLVHTVTYALRVPSGLGLPRTGHPLKESRALYQPVIATYVPNAFFGTLPSKYSLATVLTPPSGIITVAKPGEYDNQSTVFRVYVSDNVEKNVKVRVAGFSQNSSVKLVTSLEDNVSGQVAWDGKFVEYTSTNVISNFVMKN